MCASAGILIPFNQIRYEHPHHRQKPRNLMDSGAFRHFAEVRFSRFWSNASKSCKNSIFPGFVSRQKRRSPLIIWGGRLLHYPRLFSCSASEIIHAHAVQVRKAHQCLYIGLIFADFIARQCNHIDTCSLGCLLLGQPALFPGLL